MNELNYNGYCLQLCEPSLELADSFEEMRDACVAVGEDEWKGRTALAHSNVPAFIALLNRRASGMDIPNGWVPETTLWIVREKRIVVGEIELRNPLNDWLRQVGGNIGYMTHPNHRSKGIATFALRAGLLILADIGLQRPLVTCRDDNLPSIRVIEKCGGTRIEDSSINGPLRRRYILDVAELYSSMGGEKTIIK